MEPTMEHTLFQKQIFVQKFNWIQKLNLDFWIMNLWSQNYTKILNFGGQSSSSILNFDSKKVENIWIFLKYQN